MRLLIVEDEPRLAESLAAAVTATAAISSPGPSTTTPSCSISACPESMA
jgi:hypothetical protein